MKPLSTVAASMIITGTLFGLGLKTGNQDVQATARGNAFTATADNPSAIYYNPAGLTQLEGQKFNVGAYFLSYEAQYEGPLGAAINDNKIYTLPHLYYANRAKDADYAWGLGLYAPYGLGSSYDENGPLRTFATETELKYVTLAPTLSWKLSNSFSVGGGPTINYGSAHLARGLLVPVDEFVFEGGGTGFGGNIGLHWQVNEQHALGLTYRSAVKMRFEGTTELNSRTPALLPSFSGDGATELEMPAQVVIGYSYRPTKHWNFETNVEWTQWSSFDSLAIESVAGTLSEPMNWEDSIIVSAGVTRKFDAGGWLSAGYWYAQQTAPDETFNPRVPDVPLNVFSLGAGYETEAWSWGIAYQLGLGEREVSGSPKNAFGASSDGTYKMTTQAVSVTVGYKF